MDWRRQMKLTIYLRGAAALAVVCLSSSCGPKGPSIPPKVDAVEADKFVAGVNQDLIELNHEFNAAGWTQSTYITADTQYLASRTTDRYLEWFSRKAAEAKAFDGMQLSPTTARSLMLLKLGVSAPAPADAAKRAELAELGTSLEAMYGEGKYCPPGTNKDGKGTGCHNIDDLEETLATSRNYGDLTEAWVGWHSIAKPMRPKYQRFVELANEGARELGFEDLGVLWRSRYDMSAKDFEKETDRLYEQVKPLYKALHCYASK